MKAAFFRTIFVSAGFALATIAAFAQDRPPTTEQIGKDPSARRQEAEQQRSQQREPERVGLPARRVSGRRRARMRGSTRLARC